MSGVGLEVVLRVSVVGCAVAGAEPMRTNDTTSAAVRTRAFLMSAPPASRHECCRVGSGIRRRANRLRRCLAGRGLTEGVSGPMGRPRDDCDQISGFCQVM